MLKKQLKKVFILMVAAASISAMYIQPIRAQLSPFIGGGSSGAGGGGASGAALQGIWVNTTKILNNVNNLPTYLNALTALALGWLTPDTSDATANLQQNFTNLSNAVTQDDATQASSQSRFLSDYFGSSTTPSTLPYANDLTYQTLMSQPFFNPDPRDSYSLATGQHKVDSAYNYVKNASGLNIAHVIPGNNWRGAKQDQDKYFNYYSTISAVQTFNIYVMSQLYSSFTDGHQVKSLQNTLMQQASSSDWFTQAASENIGVVLRQILIYDSQIYVTLNQMLQTQREMLAAQAMSNTLVVIGNQFTENTLLGKATGVPQH